MRRCDLIIGRWEGTEGRDSRRRKGIRVLVSGRGERGRGEEEKDCKVGIVNLLTSLDMNEVYIRECIELADQPRLA